MMMAESIAVLVVCLLLVSIFLRSRHAGYALAVLPLAVIPAAHLVIRFVLYVTKGSFFGVRPAMVTAFVDVLAIALTCVLLVIISRNIESTLTRRAYLVGLAGYSILIGWAFVYNSLQIALA